jgi:hypothetical protein
MDRKFYTQLERMAEKLGTTPEVLISNMLLKKLKELEGKLEKERNSKGALGTITYLLLSFYPFFITSW